MFKVNNKDIRTTSTYVTLVYFLLKISIFYILFYIGEFEQAIAG